jgi:hypothetical protein
MRLIELKIQIRISLKVGPRDQVEPLPMPGSSEVSQQPQIIEHGRIVRADSNRRYSLVRHSRSSSNDFALKIDFALSSC